MRIIRSSIGVINMIFVVPLLLTTWFYFQISFNASSFNDTDKFSMYMYV